MKSRKGQDPPAFTAFSTLSSGCVSVKISGDVRHPGIYRVSANSMAISVINMAEPLRPLLKPLSDPAVGPMQDGAAVKLTMFPDGAYLLDIDQMTVSEHMLLGVPLDIARLGEADFERLPGIGPALARRIIEYRQNNGDFLRVDDLIEVEGIGEKKFNSLKGLFQPPLNTQ